MKKIILFLGVVLVLSSCGGNTTESTPTTDTIYVDEMVDSMTVDTTAVVEGGSAETTSTETVVGK